MWERMGDPLMEVREAVSPRRRLRAGSTTGHHSGLLRGEDIVGTFVNLSDEGQEIDVWAVHPGHPRDVPEPARGPAGLVEDAHPDVTDVAGERDEAGRYAGLRRDVTGARGVRVIAD
jgi:hypothetical protein